VIFTLIFVSVVLVLVVVGVIVSHGGCWACGSWSAAPGRRRP